MPTFWNTLFHLHFIKPSSFHHTYLPMKVEQTVFRIVGVYNSDAGELPRRNHTTKICLLILIIRSEYLSSSNQFEVESSQPFLLSSVSSSKRIYRVVNRRTVSENFHVISSIRFLRNCFTFCNFFKTDLCHDCKGRCV